jgi:hypothetical protein
VSKQRNVREESWKLVCADLNATEHEVRAAVSLMFAGRAFSTVEDPALAHALKLLNRAGELLYEYNSPLNAIGGGSSTGKPEGKEPGYERCPDAIADFIALGNTAKVLVRKARIERKANDEKNVYGGVEIDKPKRGGEWDDKYIVDVKDGKLYARKKDGTFAEGRQGPDADKLAAKQADVLGGGDAA